MAISVAAPVSEVNPSPSTDIDAVADADDAPDAGDDLHAVLDARNRDPLLRVRQQRAMRSHSLWVLNDLLEWFDSLSDDLQDFLIHHPPACGCALCGWMVEDNPSWREDLVVLQSTTNTYTSFVMSNLPPVKTARRDGTPC